MAEANKVEHNLALKVMRLTRPTFGTELTSSIVKSLPSDGVLETSLHSALGASLNLGQTLVLPQSFGNIYLGETFMSYVSLHNDSTETCEAVILKCDLQTATQRLPLLQSPQQGSQVHSGGSIDNVLSHEVKELGTHILVCEVSYSAPGKSKLNFRKFFKFNVMKPLDVKTKFYNAESEDVFLEAQVQNVTAGPLCLEKVGLDPSPMFKVTSLNTVMDTKGNVLDENRHVFGKYNYLQPQDSRQYLFCLTPRSDIKSNFKQLKGATNIGKLDIIWRTNMGDRGRLQTSQLQRLAPNHGDVRFNVESIPNIVRVNQAFKMTCTIVNNSDRTLDLELSLENVNKPKMIWSGSISRKLGLIEPAGSLQINLECIPFDTSLQVVSGVRLIDTSLKRTYNFDDFCHVYVTPELDAEGHDLKIVSRAA